MIFNDSLLWDAKRERQRSPTGNFDPTDISRPTGLAGLGLMERRRRAGKLVPGVNDVGGRLSNCRRTGQLRDQIHGAAAVQ